MHILAHADNSLGNWYMIMPHTQGHFVGFSTNFAKKIAEAAISDGGYESRLYSSSDSSAM
jgi:hypothetical protein